MSELGDFLRSRRAALTPEAAGVATYGTPRRVPGLRREEVAMLAGVSVNYYTRLEQGESHQMSESVLAAIANALHLDGSERLHLLRLAWPMPVVRRGRAAETVRPTVLALAESNTEQAVLIVSRRTDLLGGNRLARALWGFGPGPLPNMARQLFLEPSSRDLIVDWARRAAGMAAHLRMATSVEPDDPEMAELVGELSIKSAEFANLWATHPVAECSHAIHEFDHPAVGRLTLNEESLDLPGGAGQRVIFLGAQPGSDSAGRMGMLGSLFP
ncbi:helix-turn-helix transcriptional regulator [Actinoplanes sp. NBRC 103695]|uniref:helix-turn-helix transcriptional regulator n=1 Tax=Actinoplanes sp. NBRC 103695 TaxID=3032202 RepID=UPI0024A032AF|nr:helix-turn-helix transcriptional regulator [Actinoplanes sp. NBRC 103695]GLZ02438.1 DNA-binding protein [Actinoplanes sp. NBRC 103695]